MNSNFHEINSVKLWEFPRSSIVYEDLQMKIEHYITQTHTFTFKRIDTQKRKDKLDA